MQWERKVRREPGEKHRWRMSHVTTCVEWQAGPWKAVRTSRWTDRDQENKEEVKVAGPSTECLVKGSCCYLGVEHQVKTKNKTSKQTPDVPAL